MLHLVLALCVIGVVAGIYLFYYFAYEAGQDYGPRGREIKSKSKAGRSQRAIAAVRKKVPAAIGWAGVKSVRPGVAAIERVSKSFSDITNRQIALLNHEFPPATKLATDKKPFSYEELWDSCLQEAA